MPKAARAVVLSQAQRSILEKLANSRVRPKDLVERAQIVVWCADEVTNVEQAQRLGVHEQRVRRWRGRWVREALEVEEAEQAGASGRELQRHIERVLSDAPRSGTPPKFSAEQIAQLVALACEAPEDCETPVTHWTPEELAKEARKRGIVESISARHLDRLLKRGRPTSASKPLLDDVARQARGPRGV